MSADYGTGKNLKKENVSLPCDEKAYVYYNSVRLQEMEKRLEEKGSSISKELFRMLGELYHQLLTQKEKSGRAVLPGNGLRTEAANILLSKSERENRSSRLLMI